MLKQKIVVFGTGQFSKTVTSYFKRYTDFDIVAYIDSYNQKNVFKDEDITLVSPTDLFERYPPSEYKLFIAIGYTRMNQIRTDLYNKYKKLGYSFVSFVHPNVEWWDSTSIGENTFIFENNVVQQDVTVGNNVVLWSGNHIGHDSNIDDNTWITSHVVVYSNVNVGANCFLGSNINIRDGISIGKFSFIGAGSNVWNSTDDYSVFLVKPTKPASLSSDKIGSLLV